MTKLERFLRNEVQRLGLQESCGRDDALDSAANARDMLKEYLQIRTSHEDWAEHACPPALTARRVEVSVDHLPIMLSVMIRYALKRTTVGHRAKACVYVLRYKKYLKKYQLAEIRAEVEREMLNPRDDKEMWMEFLTKMAQP